MTIFDCELGEQFDRQMTDEEFAQYQIDQKTQAAAQAEADAKAAAKASALAKLKALGLSDEESAAILG
jgi:hypothetical protein